MLKLKSLLYEFPQFKKFEKALEANNNFDVKAIYGSALPFIINYIRETTERAQCIIMPGGEAAEKLCDDLRSFMPENQFAYFPSDEILPFDKGLFTPALYSQRMHALATAVESPSNILITTPQALLRKVPQPGTFKDNILHLKKGETFEREFLLEWLVDSEYERVDIIEEIGQFSARGGIVDVFSFESDVPYRIEYFDDTIESIREFDILSQLSIQQLEKTRLLGKSGEAAETASIFEFLPKNSIVWWEDETRIKLQFEKWWEDAEGRFDSLEEKPVQSLDERYVTIAETEKFCSGFLQVNHVHLESKESAIAFHTQPPAAFHGNMKLFVEHLQRHSKKRTMYVLHDGKNSRKRLEEILEAEMGSMPPLKFIDGELHSGFFMPDSNIEIFTDHEIFNRLRMRRRKRKIRVSGSLIRNLQTLEYGDYVVHIDYGVGKYSGTERIRIAGMEKECIKLLYENDDILYVRLDKLNRIQRYVSEEGFAIKLTKLGSSEWDRVKKRTRKAVENVARELVELYAKRMTQKGHAYQPDTLWQKELEASFPFEDTVDQARATSDVKGDMEGSKSMDRLVCGDVGYGKTEVAVRAAFKAVIDGKQVGVLVPTTILAQQHYRTFSERVANFPVNVEVVSRFRTRAEVKETLKKLAEGEVDIIIGTHRLLSKDVIFKELGLLIVDEEQRFGVTHKERLKELKVNVDTLTLTATPIPRTLHMALMGARDLSIVDTPPGNRLPILTEISTWDDQLLYKAITYEMDRGGQIFFVHNRVQTIDAMADMLRRLVPKARFGVAHGQMPEQTLEKIMFDFNNKEFDVLVSTMIIENGVDIPNCNTIVVNRADRFGLAQLYQLRGRVGRSDRQAYAYMIIPPQGRLSDLALKRLYAIEEFADLGSGLKIAMRDLEIRGAGNLLGHKQSGFINAVGYDLYQKILQETIESMQQETLPEQLIIDRMPVVDASVEIDAELYFPDDYITAPNEKVIIYHRLLNLENVNLIDDVVSELKDRFGPLPEPALKLIEMVKIKKLASKLYVKQAKIKRHQMTLTFDEKITSKDTFVEKELPRYINQTEAHLKFVQTDKLKVVVDLKGSTQLDKISFAKYFLLNL
ncbi:MAG: transcription-repair coupling factor [Calditrichia bacterium]